MSVLNWQDEVSPSTTLRGVRVAAGAGAHPGRGGTGLCISTRKADIR